VGVLHHLRDPWEGLRALCRLGRPGAVLKLGFYSARSRADVNQARQLVRERGIPATPSAIRAFRQHILAQAANFPLRSLLRYRDFFSMSECRDLLFHVQEHRFTIPWIKEFLDSEGLAFLGFEFNAGALQDLRMKFPSARAVTDLASWDAFERVHPKTFVGMYQFWCHRG